MRKIVFAFLVCMLCVSSGASELPLGNPDKLGFSSERLRKVSEFARRNVAEGKHAGVVTMIARHGRIVHFEATGHYGIDNDKPMEKDTLFRIFSMAKAITAVALMALYEEGHFQLADPVAKFLPEMADVKVYRDGALVAPAAPMTIEQLLTHTAGLSYGWLPNDPVDDLYREAQIWQSKDLDEFVGKVAALPLRFEPGTRFHYGVATDLVGAIVERIAKMPLDAFFRDRIFVPLGMDDTFFSVPEDKRHRLATNHRWDAEKQALALLPEGYDSRYEDVTLFSGGGGLVSTAMDYMVFCEMLRQGGSFEGTRILGPKTVQYMRLPHLTEQVRNNGATEFPSHHLYPGQNHGLGFGVITDPALSQVISSKGEYSWGGAADTKYWIDPQEDLVAVVMVQLMGAPFETRYEMKVATYQALSEIAAD